MKKFLGCSLFSVVFLTACPPVDMEVFSVSSVEIFVNGTDAIEAGIRLNSSYSWTIINNAAKYISCDPTKGSGGSHYIQLGLSPVFYTDFSAGSDAFTFVADKGYRIGSLHFESAGNCKVVTIYYNPDEPADTDVLSISRHEIFVYEESTVEGGEINSTQPWTVVNSAETYMVCNPNGGNGGAEDIAITISSGFYTDFSGNPDAFPLVPDKGYTIGSLRFESAGNSQTLTVYHRPAINIDFDGNAEGVSLVSEWISGYMFEVKILPTLGSLNHPEGLRFVGWGSTRDATVPLGGSILLSEAYTLYAIWKEDIAGPDDYTGWKQLGGQWQYFKNGEQVFGWMQDEDNRWFYFRADGVMATGWQYNIPGWGDSWFYFGTDGVLRQNGWFPDGGTRWYYADETGVIAMNTRIQGYWLGADGAWVPGA
jgi:FOG: Glucan-binding domain (YG repeat)